MRYLQDFPIDISFPYDICNIVNTNLEPKKKQLSKQNNTGLNTANIWLFWISLAILVIFYAITLRSGHYWVGDDLQYIRHAINLVEGKPYVDPLYISNTIASVGPSAYPPIFPLILSVIYVVFGLNFIAMKAVLIGFFISSLLILKIVLKQHISSIASILLTLYLGLNPEFWDFKDRILSEFPFLFFVLLALLLMQLNDTKKTYIYAILLGITMYLSYGIREIALVLPLTLITYELWHYRKVTIHSILAISLFVLLATIQKLVFGAIPTNLEFKDQLDLLIESGATSPTTFSYIKPEKIFIQGERYFWSFYHFLQIRYLPYSGYFYLFANICVLIGYITALRQKVRFTEIYFIGYLCTLLLFAGFDGFRYLLPILPFYMMYLFTGFLKFTSFCRHPIKISATGLLLITLVYSAGFSNKESSFISPSTPNTKLEQLYSFISEHTQTTDTLVAMQPRVISFFTQRPASTYPGKRPDQFMNYLRAIQTKYLITTPSLHKPQNKKELDWILNHHPNELSLVFDNETFKVYHLTNQHKSNEL